MVHKRSPRIVSNLIQERKVVNAAETGKIWKKEVLLSKRPESIFIF
jgi:hypothetical protein